MRFWAIARILPVPGSTIETAEATPDGSSTGMPALTSASAICWMRGSSVVVMVRPPRYRRLNRAVLSVPKAGFWAITLVT